MRGVRCLALGWEKALPEGWKARLFDLAPPLRALSRVARKSGILWEVRWRGLRAAAAALASGAHGKC